MQSFSSEEFFRALGLEQPSDALQEAYRRAQEAGELSRPIPMEIIPDYFPQLQEEVTAAAVQISADPVAMGYYNLLRLVYSTEELQKELFLPPEQGNAMRNFAPILMLMSLETDTQQRMIARGVDRETLRRSREMLQNILLVNREDFGYSSCDRNRFGWSKFYLAPDIIPMEDLEFHINTLPASHTIFRCRQTGEYVALCQAEETETAYHGTPMVRGGQLGEATCLPKEEYELLLSPGDPILGVHIPRGARVDAASCRKNFRSAIEFFRTCYPEHKFRAIHCHSWLMDPYLKEILPEGSKIVQFQSFFHRYPASSTGKELFFFVYPHPFERYEELPEHTSLFRSIKRTYLEGKPVYAYAGVFFPEELEEEK
jgi:hypothetical protein